MPGHRTRIRPNLRPPKKQYRFDPDGREVLWESTNWLQGSVGASSAARAEFDRVVASVGIESIVEDPSAYVWLREHDSLRFTLHGDDGNGSATSTRIVEDLEKVLRARWPDIVFSRWNLIGGFPMLRQRDTHTTLMSAEPHISKLEQFVENDVRLTPSLPWTESIKDIAACDLPADDSEEMAAMNERVNFLRVVNGHLNYIAKVRYDIVAPLSFTQRFAHLTC